MLRRKRPTSFLSKVQTDVEAATAKKKKKRAREIPPSLKDVTNKEMTSALCAEEERERISLFSLFLPEQKKKKTLLASFLDTFLNCCSFLDAFSSCFQALTNFLMTKRMTSGLYARIEIKDFVFVWHQKCTFFFFLILCTFLSSSGLDLSHNRLSTLPDELTELTQLEMVDISHNSFISVPGCLFAASRVSEINASSNYITGDFFFKCEAHF